MAVLKYITIKTRADKVHSGWNDFEKGNHRYDKQLQDMLHCLQQHLKSQPTDRQIENMKCITS